MRNYTGAKVALVFSAAALLVLMPVIVHLLGVLTTADGTSTCDANSPTCDTASGLITTEDPQWWAERQYLELLAGQHLAAAREAEASRDLAAYEAQIELYWAVQEKLSIFDRSHVERTVQDL